MLTICCREAHTLRHVRPATLELSLQRKKRCKFQHPNAQSLNQLVQCNPEKKYAFCHDYQNKICERQSCKYIHCSRLGHYNAGPAINKFCYSEEEQQYLKSHLLCLKYKCQYELGIYNLGLNSFKHLNDGSRKGSINHKCKFINLFHFIIKVTSGNKIC